MHRPLVSLVLGSMGLAGLIAACSESQPDPAPPQPRPKVTAAPRVEAPVVRVTEPSGDAGGGAAVSSTIEPAPYDGPFLGALYRETPIMSEMEWPKKDQDRDKRDKDKGAVRIGYIRQGQKVPVLPEPHAKSNCKEGWYELVQGGFVCGRYATLDLNHPKLRVAPHPPEMTAALPYQYGYNVANGTPLYRTLPSREERIKLEPWLAPKPKKVKPREVDEGSASLPTDDTGAAFARSSDGPSDAGLPLTLAKATTIVTATTTDPFSLTDEGEDAGTPWYLRQYDGGKPLLTLDDLRGEGPVVRRMVKGFFVALDKELNERGSRWWRTTYGLMAPYERIYPHDSASKFHGVWLDDAKDPAADAASQADGGAAITKKPTPDLGKPGSKSQVAIITYYKAKKYVVSASRKAVTTGDALPRHSVLKLTGDTVLINGARYDETDEGWWIRSSDATKTNPAPPPKDLAPGEKWIAVNIKTETLVAFEGDKPVFATAVSTGREDKQDKANDHKTPTGTFRIREKHIAATMDGDGATDGPYSIEDVPWIMYYSGSYALHGAFWHNSFGRQKSHGCTNLAPLDAKALFGWTEPRMPEGWHGVWSTQEHPGTRVVVHE